MTEKHKEKLDRRDWFAIARICHGLTEKEFAATVGEGGVHVNSLRQHLRDQLTSQKIEKAVDELITSAVGPLAAEVQDVARLLPSLQKDTPADNQRQGTAA